MYKVVHKPWGKEEWLELNDAYCYKRIYINAGYKTSYQYHQFKKETNYIIDGTAEVWLENDEGVVEKKIMKAGEFFNVTPPKKHRVIAITDIILQEVSTPHVDDVFRINDEFNRADGKVEAEHKTPAVLILAAGLGTRLKGLTKDVSKAMLPIANKAIISHIIEKFPLSTEFVIGLGYLGHQVRQYLGMAHPDRQFKFVVVDNLLFIKLSNNSLGFSNRSLNKGKLLVSSCIPVKYFDSIFIFTICVYIYLQIIIHFL
jgi:mannose-6-phosphate isomerase-like protein (cupin superfamily)